MKELGSYFQRYRNGLANKMLVSAVFMGINMLSSFLYTREVLQYLGTTVYGLWATITSFTSWINYFDVGIGNGMRNALAIETNNPDKHKANTITSTAYFIISCIATILFVLMFCFISVFDVNGFFKISQNVKPVILINIGFVCINFIVCLCRSQLYAEQKAEIVTLMNTLSSVLQLLGIIVLNHFAQPSLYSIEITVGLSSLAVNVIASYKLWNAKKYYKPTLQNVDLTYSKSLGSLGIKFFILQIGCLLLYSTDNLVISRLFDTSMVTPYNTSYKVFNYVLILFSAFISPVWSRITVEAEKNNYEWIIRVKKNLLLLMIPVCLLIGILCIAFQDLSKLWLGVDLQYAQGLIPLMGLFIALNVFSSIYSSILNGMSELGIQLYVSVLISVLNIPLSIYFAKNCSMGITGVIAASNVCMAISVVTLVIKTRYVLNKRMNSLTKTEK